MRICIDSCVFIRGLRLADPAVQQLVALIGPQVQLAIPRLVAQEVGRNLQSQEEISRFYRLFHALDYASLVDEPVPTGLIARYVRLGLSAKGDAYIAAFAEWMQVDYVISDNRHFLRDLQTDAFAVLDADGFISRWDADRL